MNTLLYYCLFAVLVLLFPAVQGDIDEWYPNLSNNFATVGSAVLITNTLQLTSDSANDAGRALYGTPVDASAGFSVTYSYFSTSANLPGEGLGFVLTGDKDSFLNSIQTNGENWNIANIQNMAAVIIDIKNGRLFICQVDPTTAMPLRSEITNECNSTTISSPGIGEHKIQIYYAPGATKASWKVTIDNRESILETEPLVVNPVVPNEYYFGWTASNGDVGYTDKTLQGWFANFSISPCQINNGGCSVNATCTYLDGVTIDCKCKPGFDGDGLTCTEIIVPSAPVAAPVGSPVAETPVDAPVDPPVDTPADTPTQPPVDPPTDRIITAPTGPGPEVLVPSIVIPVVAAGVAVFLGVYFGKKRQAQQKNKKLDDDAEDPALNSSGSTALIPINSGVTPSSYATMPATNGRSDQYNIIPSSGASTTDKTDVNPTGIDPADIDKKMQIPYSSLVFVKEIGAGSYGKVFLGEWRGAEVAIKVNNTVTDMDGFLAEAKLTLGIAPHPNLVQTFGISLDGSYPCIVLEFCGGGSLDNLVFGAASASISDTKRREFALKIAFGLIHLHKNSVVHRDLAARNILLSTEGQPKVSDFGMSRVIQDEGAKGKTKNNMGPIRWMSPESLKDRTYSIKSDVWSYGILVWEIVAGKEPHEEEDQLFVGVKIRDEAFHPAIPDNCDPVLREVMEMCWKKDPNERPTMEEIAKHLRQK